MRDKKDREDKRTEQGERKCWGEVRGYRPTGRSKLNNINLGPANHGSNSGSSGDSGQEGGREKPREPNHGILCACNIDPSVPSRRSR